MAWELLPYFDTVNFRSCAEVGTSGPEPDPPRTPRDPEHPTNSPCPGSRPDGRGGTRDMGRFIDTGLGADDRRMAQYGRGWGWDRALRGSRGAGFKAALWALFGDEP